MATIPPITVPIHGELITAPSARLKCAPCTDQHILEDRGTDPDTIPDAFTIVTLMQTFAAGGQQIAAPVQVPVCYPCRKQQLGTVSKAGLAVA